MKKFYGGYSTQNMRKNNKFPKNLKANLSNNKIKKRKSFNKDIYNININNFNINTRRDFLNKSSNKTIELVTDFKKALEQKEEIKKKLFNNKSFFTCSNKDLLKNKNNKNFKFNRHDENLIHAYQSYITPFKKNHTIEINYKTGNSFYYPEKIKHSCKNFNEIKKGHSPTINRNKSENNLIKIENKNLIKESSFLINENSYIISRISDYKAKSKSNPFRDERSINYYDENLNKFINSIKYSLNYNVNNNLELSKTIINKLKNIQTIEKDIKNINNKLTLEKQNNIIRKKNEENKKRIIKLNEEKSLLNYELEKLKIYFKELKSKEKILSIKYESELKAKQDKNDLITKLRFTIQKMNKSQNYLNKKGLNPVKNLKLNFYSSNKHLNDINQLNLIYKFLEDQKSILTKENRILRKDNYKNNNIIQDKSKTKELKDFFDKLKRENIDIKLKIKNKENQIIILKDIINKYSKALNEQNMNNEILKLNLDKLTKEDFDDTEYKNILINNKVNNLINKRSYYQNLKNEKNINLIKTYEDIIKKKDMEISNLENQINHKHGILGIIEDKVKPLYKRNNNNISKTNSFLNSISDSNNKIPYSNSKENIGWKNKQETYYDKIRKRKNKLLYMNNIDNILFYNKK